MIEVPKATMLRIDALKKTILELQDALSNQLTEYNCKATELHAELIGNDKQTHDKNIEELNQIRAEVHEQMEAFFAEQDDDWQESEDGKLYSAWMEGWDYDFDEFDVDDFEELDEPRLLEADDFDALTEAPGIVGFPDSSAVKALFDQAKLEKWSQAVTAGTTRLGFKQWCAEQLQLEAWRKAVLEAKTNLGFDEWVETVRGLTVDA
jgi:uncharacterized protein YhaN